MHTREERPNQPLQLPTGDTIKINFDASWCKKIQTVNIGVVARDKTNKIVDRMNWKQRNIDIKTMKVLAIQKGAEWQNIIIETDSQMVHQQIMEGSKH